MPINQQSMHRFFWLALISILIICLSACGVAPVVEIGKPIQVRDLSVIATKRLNQFGDSRSRLLTLDGFMLNDLRLFADIKPGEHVFLVPRGRAERRGEGLLYRAEMSELDVQELFVDAVKGSGAANVVADGLRPAKFGARKGFRFDLSFEAGSGISMGGRSGLRYRGVVLAEVQNQTLSYVYFDAPEEHYFKRDAAMIEQIFQNLQAP
jgi:hypothetical protein